MAEAFVYKGSVSTSLEGATNEEVECFANQLMDTFEGDRDITETLRMPEHVRNEKLRVIALRRAVEAVLTNLLRFNPQPTRLSAA